MIVPEPFVLYEALQFYGKVRIPMYFNVNLVLLQICHVLHVLSNKADINSSKPPHWLRKLASASTPAKISNQQTVLSDKRGMQAFRVRAMAVLVVDGETRNVPALELHIEERLHFLVYKEI